MPICHIAMLAILVLSVGCGPGNAGRQRLQEAEEALEQADQALGKLDEAAKATSHFGAMKEHHNE